MVDITTLKHAASGRWPEIITRIGGVGDEILDGRHHPCPKCGGKDRFRAFGDFRETGGLMCNKCFATDNGDGFSALGWLMGEPFPAVVDRVSDLLGVDLEESKPVDMLDAVCQAKRIPRESLLSFGAALAVGPGGSVVRVPMYGPDGEQCSHFDMSTASEKLRKGLNAKGKPAGLFWFERPSGGLVLLTEGVKDAAALDSLDYHAVGMPTCYLDPKFAPLFEQCDVVLVPDRDHAGAEGAGKTAAALEGHAASFRVATLPGVMKETGGDGVREVLEKYGEQAIRYAVENASDTIPTVEAPQAPRDAGKFKTLADATREFIDQFSRGEDLVSTGFSELDHALGGGVARGEMIVLAARPGQGKTAFAMQLLHNEAAAGHRGLLVSQEMSAAAIGKRNVQYLNEEPELFWTGKEDRMRALVAGQEAERAPIYIVENCESANHVAEVIGEAVEEMGVSVVAVDYLQLLKAEGRSRYEQITNASVAVRECATRHNLVLLALCQLSRAVEQRTGMVPQMSDIKESGQIEQDADVIMSLQWPIRNNPMHGDPTEYFVRIFKNRNREIRDPAVRFNFQASRQMFSQIDPDIANAWVP